MLRKFRHEEEFFSLPFSFSVSICIKSSLLLSLSQWNHFHYISIFNVVLPLPASDERLHAISNIVFLFLNVRDHGSSNIVYFC